MFLQWTHQLLHCHSLHWKDTASVPQDLKGAEGQCAYSWVEDDHRYVQDLGQKDRQGRAG